MKKIVYQVVREIHTLPLEGETVAYCDVTSIEGKAVSSVEGISTQAMIDNIQNDQIVPILEDVYLFHKDVVEFHANKNLFQHRTEAIEKYMIEKPYTHVSRNGADDFLLLRTDFAALELFTLSGDKLLQPIFFNEAFGLISDKYFDLDKIIEKLEKRDDIIWTKNQRTNSCLISIYDGWGLEFRYIPSKEVWEVIKEMNSSFLIRQYLIKEVLEIHDCKIVEDDEEKGE
ncbi:hypothetical protein ACFVS2_25200 [Brevibacillus sp. NPDC058079]|uniref:hypothetical protein n=1 Tax=Brevibacillus sp. NPDC058079 TaxID=3346330 RepID=UPI0036EE8C1C